MQNPFLPGGLLVDRLCKGLGALIELSLSPLRPGARGDLLVVLAT